MPERGSAEEDAAALSLDALPVPRLAAAVRALLDRATHSPALPAATPAQTAALRESHAAALKAAPLAALRDLSSEITTAYKDMKGARSKAVLGKRRPRNADDWAVDVLAAQPAPAAAEDNDAPPATLPVGTALVRVSMYGFTIPGVRTDDALLQTVLLPADSTLETLRDALQPGCVAERRAARFGCHGCGAFFYFEGCVYTDNRNGAVDLSAPLRAFAGDLLVTGEGAAAQATEEDPSAGSGFLPPTPSFAGGPVAKGRVDARGWSVADMAATRLFDLKVHVGKRYLFAHQGTCEHTIRIDDVRLLSSTDAQLASAYPRTTFRLERVRRRREVFFFFFAFVFCVTLITSFAGAPQVRHLRHLRRHPGGVPLPPRARVALPLLRRVLPAAALRRGRQPALQRLRGVFAG